MADGQRGKRRRLLGQSRWLGVNIMYCHSFLNSCRVITVHAKKSQYNGVDHTIASLAFCIMCSKRAVEEEHRATMHTHKLAAREQLDRSAKPASSLAARLIACDCGLMSQICAL